MFLEELEDLTFFEKQNIRLIVVGVLLMTMITQNGMSKSFVLTVWKNTLPLVNVVASGSGTKMSMATKMLFSVIIVIVTTTFDAAVAIRSYRKIMLVT